MTRALILPALVVALGACSRGTERSSRAPTDSSAATRPTAASSTNTSNNTKGTTMSFKLTSSAITSGGSIPPKFTCEGVDVSPPLNWSGAPDGTRSFGLIVDDPDAPDPAHPKMTYVHWVAYNIPAQSTGLAENASKDGMPQGSAQGDNDWKKAEYGGPCPPIGTHRYFFKLYALDTELNGLSHPTKSDLENAMQGHVVAKTELMGTYKKQK